MTSRRNGNGKRPAEQPRLSVTQGLREIAASRLRPPEALPEKTGWQSLVRQHPFAALAACACLTFAAGVTLSCLGRKR
jgi:hypothetical protein